MEVKSQLFFSQLGELIVRRMLLLLSLLTIGVIVVAFNYLASASQQIIRESAVTGAQRYLEALGEFRTLYTSEVVKTAQEKGLIVTHDYQRIEGAIPLPATLSMALGEKIGAHQAGAKTFLYSRYPFPWRTEENQKFFSQSFAKLAWEQLNNNPTESFYRFEQVSGRPSIRYAIADRMRADCVDCHNNHPDTPKNDWKVGDVRGVMEVILPIDAAQLDTQSQIQATFSVMALMVLLVTLILGLVFSRLQRDTRQLTSKNTALQRQKVEIEVKNNKLLSANQQLVNYADEIAKSSQYKTDFLAAMSHEIRTPMNGILGTAQLLNRSELNSQQQTWLETISTSGQVLLSVLNNVLDFSKIEAGKVEISPIEFNLEQAAYDCLCLHLAKAQEKGIELILHYQADCPHHVLGDEMKIRQVMLNLISNAVKFTSHGHVLLEITKSDNSSVDQQLKISCQDSGIGISKEQQIKLFSSFYQADVSTTRKYGGTGLGLAISKGLVKVMKGEIGVVSEGKQGADFWVRLPLATSRFDQPLTLIADKPLKVLLIDNNPLRRQKISQLLLGLNLRLELADSCNQAQQLLRHASSDFDFVICQQQVLHSEGLILTELMCVNYWQQQPLLLITSGEEPNGAGDDNISILSQPIRSDLLIEKIQHLLGLSLNLTTSARSIRQIVIENNSSAHFANCRVLLADDVPLNQQIAVAMLEDIGINPDIANNGIEAIELWQHNSYDLILMDCLMPEMDGYQATREIRKREQGSEQSITIIALTANAMDDAKKGCFDAGMNDFLSKPFMLEDLHAMIERWWVSDVVVVKE